MKITYSSVREPRWANHEKTAIDCLVYFEHLKSEVPFIASETDVEPHGREIFGRCMQGEFGEIAPPIARTESPENFEAPQLPAAWHDINQFLDEANRENASGTERGLVLVWAAMLDEMLCRLLERFLVEDKVTQGVLRGGPGDPLTSLSSRTKVAFSLGLIAKDELQAIDKVRTIRNDFAHRVGISLEHQSFRSKCEDLYNRTVGDGATFEARHFYSAGCARLLMVLSNRIAEIEGERCQKRNESKPLQQR
ncbi:hypothetical protein ABWH88_05295 [Marinobacter adhaerens]|uniref:Uncharacterized protein n=2 Tax=Marinobacter adhaerens TaxID=1033846 RepID=A0ABX8IPK9_9GAMM|nr:hypothetical protein [Marinobacter adhaerens]ADP96728.1 conserved hypothetical protein [Marinobacter adhaerens HP15]MBW4979285.1 hypothetical protein [Marinobacter adhaerens]QWV14696.1 hypothetical protein KQ249_08950 [Marinobacter adhaerens]